jgi:predicted nucleotide-binding protein
MAIAKDAGRIRELLKQKVAELKKPDMQYYDAPAFAGWKYETKSIIRNHFGPDSPQLSEFYSALSRQKPGMDSSVRRGSEEWERKNQETHLYRMPYLQAVINGIISELESGVTPVRVVAGSPKAFIAHGGQSARLRKLCDFLEALGVQPAIAEWSASEGRWTEEHVDKRMEDSDSDIILAEYGGIIDVRTGAKHPRLNVIDELARSRRIRPSRTILLLEKGVDLPSNVSGIVYERFTKRNMEKALIKVARELRKFGILISVKPE